MSGTELSRVRTEFRLRLLEPINESPLESSGADIVMQSSGFHALSHHFEFWRVCQNVCVPPAMHVRIVGMFSGIFAMKT